MKKTFSQKITITVSLIFFLLTFSHLAEARKIYSRQTGNWTTTTSWVGGVVPVSGDTVIIQYSHTISVTANLYSNSTYMFLVILGTLDLTNNGKMSFSAASNIIIETGARILGNNNADQISVGTGSPEYSGSSGNITGPSYVNNGHSPVSGEGTGGCGCYTGIGNCVITSSDGYSVSINVSAQRIVVHTDPCTFGYNYDVELDYVVTFSGSNIPASLYTLQGNVICGTTSLFFDLPNSGGTGTVTSTGNAWRGVSDCATATPVSLNCLNASIQIDGPGIASGSSCSSTLPITLVSFSGRSTDEGIQLNWVTAMERDFDYFEIQRADKDLTFKTIGKQAGEGGLNVTTEYTYLDRAFGLKKNYYRLKSVNLDGSFEYSNVIMVEGNTEFVKTSALLYPNPTYNGQFFIRETDQYSSPDLVVVYNGYGQEIMRKSMENSQEVSLPNGLATGVYLVKIMFKEGVKVEQLVVH